MSNRGALRCALSALGAMLLVSTAGVRALRAQTAVTVTFGGFATPSATDFTAGFISGTATYTVSGCSPFPCKLTMAATQSGVSEPTNTTAATNLQYSLNGGTTWTTLTTTAVTLNSSISSGSGSFLLRYQLGWQSGSSPYTPPGTYSLPMKFTLTVL
jgi:hypothetical protein